MTIGDVRQHNIGAAARAAPLPSWVILLSSLVLAIGMAWRSSVRAPPHDYAMPGPAQAENGRGRSATTPSEIPWAGWKDILLRVYQRLSRDRLLLIAAGVTFYLILAIFPAIAALVSIYGLFFDPKSMMEHLDLIAGVAPGGAIDVLREQLTRLSQQSGTALGLSFFVSLAIALWSATSGVKAIFDGLNVAYERKKSAAL